MLYLHENKPAPVIHRDLKTANLLVSRDWTCKVADFNLSRLMDDEVRVTSSGGSAPGNPRWLAPEIFTGAPFSTKTDCYSFGMVMYEILVYDVPFRNRNEWAIVGLVQTGDRPEIPAVDELPRSPGDTLIGIENYIELMKRCWSQDTRERPGFEEIAASLKDMVNACVAGRNK